MESAVLLPMPRTLDYAEGIFAPKTSRQYIQLDPDMSAELVGAGRVIQRAASEAMRCDWQIVAGRAESDETCVTLAIVRFEHDREQYTIDVRPSDILIRASSPAMAFYAAHTLAQLFRQFPNAVPCLHI